MYGGFVKVICDSKVFFYNIQRIPDASLVVSDDLLRPECLTFFYLRLTWLTQQPAPLTVNMLLLVTGLAAGLDFLLTNLASLLL